MEHFPFGLRAEKRVEQLLRSFSWRTFRTPASRGPFDVIAQSGEKRMLVQIKAVRTKTALVVEAPHALQILRERISLTDERRLHDAALNLRACALACLVNGSRIWLFDFDRAGYRLNFEGRLPALCSA